MATSITLDNEDIRLENDYVTYILKNGRSWSLIINNSGEEKILERIYFARILYEHYVHNNMQIWRHFYGCEILWNGSSNFDTYSEAALSIQFRWFRWDDVITENVSESNSDKNSELITFLKYYLSLDWVENAQIDKEDENTITITNESEQLRFIRNKEKGIVTLQINEAETYEYTLIEGDVYDKTNPPTIHCKVTVKPDHFIFELLESSNIPLEQVKHIEILRAKFLQSEELCPANLGFFHTGNYVISKHAFYPEVRIDERISTADLSCPAAVIYPNLPPYNSENPITRLKVAFVVVPKSEWLNVVGNIEGLPYPTINGIWTKQHPDLKESYLFIGMKEGDCADVINYAQMGGFKYIVIEHSWWLDTTDNNQININTSNYPNELDSLKSVADMIHCNELKFGLHINFSVFSEAVDELSKFEAIVEQVKDIYEEVNADFLYLDGNGGTISKIEAYSNYDWYAKNLETHIIFQKLREIPNANLFFEGSVPWGGENYQWHIFARSPSDDHPWIGVKYFTDYVRIGHYYPFCRGAMIEQNLGWIGLRAKTDVNQNIDWDLFNATMIDEIEYQMNKALGYGVPISLQTFSKAINENGFSTEILKLISRYLYLTKEVPLPLSLRQNLQEPGKEYHLIKHWCKWGFKERVYVKHYVGKQGTEESSEEEQPWNAENNWSFNNPFSEQSPKIMIRAVPNSREYNYSKNEELEINELTYLFGAEGIEISSPLELNAINITNNSCSPGWCKIAAPLNIDLSQCKGIGIMIIGDNKGEIISIQLNNDDESVRNDVRNRQYQFTVDFEGEKYIEIPVPTGDELVGAPDGREKIKAKYSLRNFDYSNIKGLTIYIKNIPPNNSIDISINSIKALYQEPLPIKYPSLTIGDNTITFPVTLNPEEYEYLIFDGARYKKYDKNNRVVKEGVPEGNPLTAVSGNNTITYTSNGSKKALVTVILEDKHPIYIDGSPSISCGCILYCLHCVLKMIIKGIKEIKKSIRKLICYFWGIIKNLALKI